MKSTQTILKQALAITLQHTKLWWLGLFVASVVNINFLRFGKLSVFAWLQNGGIGSFFESLSQQPSLLAVFAISAAAFLVLLSISYWFRVVLILQLSSIVYKKNESIEDSFRNSKNILFPYSLLPLVRRLCFCVLPCCF